jgi:hypothetical protein
MSSVNDETAIADRTPLQDLYGIITPSSLGSSVFMSLLLVR